MEGEIFYGSSEESQAGVMSERVQQLARNIYQEFQRMIQKYDEDVVKVILPSHFVLVNIFFIHVETSMLHPRIWCPTL